MFKRILSLFGDADTLPFNFKPEPKPVDTSGGLVPFFNIIYGFIGKFVLVAMLIAGGIVGSIVYLIMR